MTDRVATRCIVVVVILKAVGIIDRALGIRLHDDWL
jgi:hypothetical protein